MELTDSRQSRCLETANSLQGRARRLLMARTVTALGAGGHRRTARALGGAAGPCAKGSTHWRAGAPASRPLPHAVVSGWQPLCRTCDPLSAP